MPSILEAIYKPIVEVTSTFAEDITGLTVRYNTFVFMVKGTCTLQYDSYPETELTAGNFLYIPYESILNGSIKPDSTFIMFRLPLFCELCDHHALLYSLYESYESPDEEIHISVLPVNELLQYFLEGVSQYISTGIDNELFYEVKIREFLLILASYYEPDQLTRLFETTISRDPAFSLFVFRNWQRVKNARELAALSIYNENTFNRRFKEVFRVTPYQWLDREKTSRILHELKYTKKTFKIIADEFDFGSLQQFNTYCNMRFGVPPGGVRNGDFKDEVASLEE